MTKIKNTCLVLAFFLAFSSGAYAQTATKVFLNGTPSPVYFNDGDSFRVLAGRYKGSRARLAGFNTLESYGPVHQWGSWTAQELSRYATLGTLNARKGVWRCTSDGNKDGYGRILWDCPDLSVDQLRKGLAHTMTVTKQGAAPALVAAQKEAITFKRGIWAHGVPDFIMTSAHSGDEWSGGRGPYNRLISSVDGHTEKWKHNHVFAECQTVCQPALDFDQSLLVGIVRKMRAEPGLQPALTGLNDAQLVEMATTFAKEGRLDAMENEDARLAIEQALAMHRAYGDFTTTGKPASCMIYVAFKRRYGPTRATCLR